MMCRFELPAFTRLGGKRFDRSDQSLYIERYGAMGSMPRVIHFEIPAEDPERAVEFYKKVFGWKIDKWEGPIDYWLVMTGENDEPGINGAIHDNKNFKSVVNTVAVDSIDEQLEEVRQAGGKVLIPKGSVKGLGYVAFAEDTEGNAFGMLQRDPTVE